MAEGHSSGCSRKPGEGCYKWFRESTDYDNGESWTVVVGSQTSVGASTDVTLQIREGGSSGVVVDEALHRVATAVGEVFVNVRRMLCPPGGRVEATSLTNFHAVQCCCLEKALAIL